MSSHLGKNHKIQNYLLNNHHILQVLEGCRYRPCPPRACNLASDGEGKMEGRPRQETTQAYKGGRDEWEMK